MEKNFFCIRLPFLRITKYSAKLPENILFLNPGLSSKKLPESASERYFTPDMPMAELYADMLAEETRNASSEIWLHGVNASVIARDMALQNELAAIADFAEQKDGRERAAVRNNILEYAQKILIWFWVREEMQAELLALERRIFLREIALDKILDGDDRKDVPEQVRDMSLPTYWRKVLRNVSYFLSPDYGIFAEGEMAWDLRENLAFAAPESVALDMRCDWLDDSVKIARASVLEAMGYHFGDKSKLTGTDLDQNLLAKRWWFIKI